MIKTKDLHLHFQTEVVYSINGEQYKLILEDSAFDGRVRAGRMIETREEAITGFRLQVHLSNEGKEPVRIEEVRMARFAKWEDFSIRGGDWKEYRLLCEGRHKNDIPTVCTLGKQDESWMDGAEALKESGDAGE